MTNLQLVQQKLPQDLWNLAEQLNIPDNFLASDPDLTVLILRSRSLAKNEEKQNWFNLIPMMNQEQIEKLRDILTRERDKIAEIEAKYEQKKQEIRAKYQMKFDAATYNDKVAQLRSNEQNIAEQDSKDADDLLNNL
jgi:hypothetical protein